MNTLIRVGFVCWKLQHGGCRHFVHAKKSVVREFEFKLLIGLREQIIHSF